MARSHNAGSRRFRLVSLLLPVVLGLGVLALTAPQAQAIAALSMTPISGEEVVPVGTNVTVTFDVPALGVNGSTFTLNGPAGQVPAMVTGSGTTWTLNPDANLRGGTTYTASLAGTISDAAAGTLGATSWAFTTDVGPPPDTVSPLVTTRVPGRGATGVPLDSVVTVTFDENVQGVDESSFVVERASTGTNVPGLVVRRRFDNRWTLIPDDNLRRGTRYRVLLFGSATGIRDLDGNALLDTDWTFSTRTGAGDTLGPAVLSRNPRNGAVGVSRRTDVTVRFSRIVRRVDEGSFTLTNNRTGNDVGAFVSRDGSRRWVLDPDRTLARDTRYIVTLRGGRLGIRDLDGNRLDRTTSSFRTTG